MAVIGAWGTIPILDSELKSLTFDYKLRYAILPIIYGNPVIQFIGKDVIEFEMRLDIRDYYKTYDFWVDRHTGTFDGNLKNLTIHTYNFGDFYHTDTSIEWLLLNYFENAVDNGTITRSIHSHNEIVIRGLQTPDL